MGAHFWILAIVFAGILNFGQPKPTDGFTSAIVDLPQYQAKIGGFFYNDKEDVPNAEATFDALRLAHVYGLKSQINVNDAIKFLQSLKNADHGYALRTGGPSDLFAVRLVVLSYKLAGITVPEVSELVNYIKSLLDTDTSLFAARTAEKADISSTAFALDTLEALGESQSKFFQGLLPSLHQTLKKHYDTEKDLFVFPGETSPLASNAYAIIVSKAAGFSLSEPKKIASAIAKFQDLDPASVTYGGFFTDAERTVVSYDGARAIAALRVLDQQYPGANVFDSINLDALIQYAKAVPAKDLRLANFAHLSLLWSPAFRTILDVNLSYQTLDGIIAGDTVVQGTQLKPVLTIALGPLSLPSLEVSGLATFASGVEESMDLKWNADEKKYVADKFTSTSNKLGKLTIDYSAGIDTPGFLGRASFTLRDTKLVGYGVTIEPAVDFGGKQVKERESFGINTEFKFQVTLFNASEKRIVSGDFRVSLSVFDSSDIQIHADHRHGETNREALEFTWVLRSPNIPAGTVAFVFEVSSDAGPLATVTKQYVFQVTMIAGQISFENFIPNQQAPKYRIGETVKVLMEPASYPDLRQTYPYEVDHSGAEVASKRKFFMDVATPSGLVLTSIAGVPVPTQTSHSRYEFALDIPATLDFLGNNLVSFRYVPVRGSPIKLQPYDSFFNEPYEDAAALNFTVSAELRMVDVVEKPSATDFHYGTEIVFRFKVRDFKTGKLIHTGTQEHANIFLLLQHMQSGRAKPLITARQPAVADQASDSFIIRWPIDANALRGPGVITLIAQDADGKALPLLMEGKDEQAVEIKIRIGGNIRVESTSYTTALIKNLQSTVFSVQFKLYCQKVALHAAQLRAAVLRLDPSTKAFTQVADLPVATSPSGHYQVSWSVPHDKAAPGEYRLAFFREVDRFRAEESREYRERRARKEGKPIEEATASNATWSSVVPAYASAAVKTATALSSDMYSTGVLTSTRADVPETPVAESYELEPFFDIVLPYKGASKGWSFLRMEWLATFIVGFGYYSLYKSIQNVSK